MGQSDCCHIREDISSNTVFYHQWKNYKIIGILILLTTHYRVS